MELSSSSCSLVAAYYNHTKFNNLHHFLHHHHHHHHPSSSSNFYKRGAISYSSSSSLQMLRSPTELGCSLYADLKVKNFQNYGHQDNMFIHKRNHAWTSLSFFDSQATFTGMPYANKRHNRDKLSRHIIVRSEIAGAGAPSAAYNFSELHIRSKVRGILFYAATSFSAIFLFVFMFLAHPIVLLMDRHRRTFHHLIAKIWASSTLTPFFNVKFEGLENLPPQDTPAVYVSNHQSFLDIYTLLTLGRSFKFISKTAIFLFPVIGWAMFLMGIIPLKRMDSRSQLKTMKRCMELIKNGGSVFFFPEGTRSKDGSFGAFKKGAFSIAAKAGVPVVPITLTGTGKIMPAGMEGRLNEGSVKVVIHQPIIGNDPDVLCSEARNIIANEINRQG